MIEKTEFLENFREVLDDILPGWPSQEIDFDDELFSLGLRDMGKEVAQPEGIAGEANRTSSLGPGILSLIELVDALERKFKVKVDDDCFLDLWTVGDIFQVLNGKITP